MAIAFLLQASCLLGPRTAAAAPMISRKLAQIDEDDNASLSGHPVLSTTNVVPRSPPPCGDTKADPFEFLKLDPIPLGSDRILFCGKHSTEAAQASQIMPTDNHQTAYNESPTSTKRGARHPRWAKRLPSFNGIRSMSRSAILNKKEDGYRRLSPGLCRSSSRWYCLMFGSMRQLPGEMELDDIKNRQSRMQLQQPRAMFGLVSSDDNDHEIVCRSPAAGTGDGHRHHHRGITVVKVISCIGSF